MDDLKDVAREILEYIHQSKVLSIRKVSRAAEIPEQVIYNLASQDPYKPRSCPKYEEKIRKLHSSLYRIDLYLESELKNLRTS